MIINTINALLRKYGNKPDKYWDDYYRRVQANDERWQKNMNLLRKMFDKPITK